MSKLFENLKSAIVEAIDCAKQPYEEASSEAHSEELVEMECDGMTAPPIEPSDGAQEESDTNMLLRDLGRGGN